MNKPDPGTSRPAYPLVILSDTHIGMKNASTDRLCRFLEELRCDTLILNGDVIDGHRLDRQQPRDFTEKEKQVLDALNALIARGTQVIYLPGNHDEKLRDMKIFGKTLHGIRFEDSYVHQTPAGKRHLILHGDIFDVTIEQSHAVPGELIRMADKLHVGALYAGAKIDRLLPSGLRRRFNLASRVRHISEHISNVGAAFAHAVRERDFKPASLVRYMKESILVPQRTFEQKAVAAAREQGCDSVICGHTHISNLKTENGILYANSGDWVHSFTCLAFDTSGECSLLRIEDQGPISSAPRPANQHRSATEKMIASVRQVWPGRSKKR